MTKITWVAAPEARAEIANFIRSRASGIADWETQTTGEIAKKDIEKVRAIVKELNIIADQIEIGEIK
jgi:hypothetical protein